VQVFTLPPFLDGQDQAHPNPRRLVLSKYEATGNDFLVMIDARSAVSLGPEEVRALCDRRRGVGADGFITVRGGRGKPLSMHLRNADGGVAEMTGNGIRCVAHAAVEAGLVTEGRFAIETAAGSRVVELRRQGDGEAFASVEMGVARITSDLGPYGPALSGRQACRVDVGNPHLVVLADGTLDELPELGSRLQEIETGINVELVRPGPGPDALTLRVWERGVGETLACGTGSVAAAAVAHGWGLVRRSVSVHNPGGRLEVRLPADPAYPIVLVGPVHKVADVIVDVGSLVSYCPA